MRVRVSLVGDLARYSGVRTLDLELQSGASVRDLLVELDRHASSKVSSVLVHPVGIVSSSYAIMRNGSNVNLAQGLDTVLNDGDEISVLPRLGGG